MAARWRGMVKNNISGGSRRARPGYRGGVAPAEGIEGAGLTKYVIRGGSRFTVKLKSAEQKTRRWLLSRPRFWWTASAVLKIFPDQRCDLDSDHPAGAGRRRRTVNRTTVDVDCSHIRNGKVPHELARKIRASLLSIGALGRFGSRCPLRAAATSAAAH